MTEKSRLERIREEFQTFNTDLLSEILRGHIDIRGVIVEELKGRHCDPFGNHVDSHKAKEAWVCY